MGETWRSQRWDDFVLNTPNWALQLPGFEYQGPAPDEFAPLAEVIAYLNAYARSFDAPVRSGVEVTHVSRIGSGFLVGTSDGAFDADSVVVAAGAYQRPNAAPLADRVAPEVLQLHTSEYLRPEQLPPGGVLIVGSGQSGCQIAEELLAAGRAVYLSVGRCPWLPRRYRGRELVHWLIDTGLADDTVEDLPSPSARLTCNPPVSGNGGGHDCNPRWLARHGAILLGRVGDIAEGVVRVGDGLEESLALGDEFVANFKRRADEYVERRGWTSPPPSRMSPTRRSRRGASSTCEPRASPRSCGRTAFAPTTPGSRSRDRRAGMAASRAGCLPAAGTLLRRPALAPQAQVLALVRRRRGRRARRGTSGEP